MRDMATEMSLLSSPPPPSPDPPQQQQPERSTASFRTQADALLRKNLAFQKRSVKTNACLISFPIFLCLLLLLIQVSINQILSGSKYQCGCTCIPVSGTSSCQKKCGIEYSTQLQASSCSIPNPTEWPAFMQVPEPQYRAVDQGDGHFSGLPNVSCRQSGSCPVSVLFTGKNRSIAESISSSLFTGPLPANVSDSLNVLSVLVPGSGSWTYSNNYIEPAFTSQSPNYILRPDCSNLSSSVIASFSLGAQSLSTKFQCLKTNVLWRDNHTIINNELYQGFRKGNPGKDINSISVAYDFGSTNFKKFDVTIWYNSTYKNDTGFQSPGLVRVSRSMNLAAQAFLRLIRGPNAELPLWFVAEMPKPETTLRLDFSSLLGPLFFMWVIQLLFPVMLTSLVYEKEHNLRMMMKMHGLGDSPYWLISYIYFLVISIVYVLCLIIFGSIIGLKFFRLNSYSIQIVFYFIYINLQIALGFFASTLFSNVKTATVVGYQYVFGFGLLGSYLFQFFVEDESFSRAAIFAMELLPGFSLYRGLYEFSEYAFIGNYQGIRGMNWRNLKDHENGMRQILGIMIVEWILFLLFAYYLDQVVASGSGVKKSPFFFLNHIFNAKEGTLRRPSVRIPGSQLKLQMDRPDVARERATVEEVVAHSSLEVSIVCDDLRKVYPGKDGNPDKIAVHGLSLAVPRGECFGMLGPNGAGKTSSINMMVGLLTPTSGTAYIEGHDIRREMDKIYSCMGVCPQHDLLWEALTGREHLLFYGRLKNLKGVALKNAIDASLKSVNLYNGGVADKQSGKYSGGMKRRLSVAISLIGNPKVVYMDEPSTGLDPASRRNLWDVVKQAKRNCAVILTTHSMEEAETLCDRVGIFVNGQLQCIGNTKELKSRYGGTYVFTITTPQSEEDEVSKLVSQLSTNARRIYSLSGTQKFEIPKKDVKISDVFRTMEHAKTKLHIQAWGFADTNLEDVFIKVARKADVESNLS